MKEYLDLLQKVRETGRPRGDRTGIGTHSLFGERLEVDLSSPALLTTKAIDPNLPLTELAWFLRGETSTHYLHTKGVKLWDPWADDTGRVGRIYGFQWRRWAGIDQLGMVVESLSTNPESRRHVVSAWNVGDLTDMALPPCPAMFQFYTRDQVLDCHVYQRSADVFLGLPFDLFEYGILTAIIAQQVGLVPGRLIFSFGDLHLYRNHMAQADMQLARTPMARPGLVLDPGATIDNFEPEMARITNYNPQPGIYAKVAV